MYESRKRTVVRVLTWRAGGVLLGIFITWVVTGSIVLGVELFGTYNIVRLLTHYAHERLWLRVRWGQRDETGGVSGL